MNIFATNELTDRVGLFIIVHNTPDDAPFDIDKLIHSEVCKDLTPREIQNLRFEIQASYLPEGFRVRATGFKNGSGYVAFLNASSHQPGTVLKGLMVQGGEYRVGMYLDYLDTANFDLQGLTKEIISTLNDRDRRCIHFQQRRSVDLSKFSFTFITRDYIRVRAQIQSDSLWEKVVRFDYCYASETNDLLFTVTDANTADTSPTHDSEIYYDQYHRNGQISRIIITEVQDLQGGKPFTDLFEYLVLRHVHAESIDIYKDKDFTFAYKIIEKHHTNEAFYEEMAARNPDTVEEHEYFMLYPTFRKVLVREAAGKYPELANNCVALQG